MQNADCYAWRTIVRMWCAVVLAAAVYPASAQRAERDICEKMTGEQLRRCIEASSRAQPTAPSAAQPIVVPAAPGGAATVTEQPKRLQRLDCTKVPQPDQPLCVHRNSALLECGNRGKYPDYNRCLEEIMLRAPNPNIADCGRLPERQRAGCIKHNKVYAVCRDDKMNYFACLETQLAKQK